MTYAIPDDVAVELGRSASSLTDQERAQWQAWLSRVERSIGRAFKRGGFDLNEQISFGEVLSADVVDVEIAAVIRKIQNPTWGESSVSTTIDDGSITRRREGGSADVDPLDLLDSELSDLLPTRTSGAFSTRPAFSADTYGDNGYILRGW